MRFILTLVTGVLLLGGASAQNTREHPGRVPERINELKLAGTQFTPMELFRREAQSDERDQSWRGALDAAQLLRPQTGVFAQVLTQRPTHLALTLPTSTSSLELELEEVNPFTDDFAVVTASTGEAFAYAQGMHYRGMVRGEMNSLVSISVFKDEVMGFVSTPDGDFTIGKMEGDASNTHIIYRTSDFRNPPASVCGTADDGHGYSEEDLTPQSDERTVKCVRLYWEVNYDIFQGKGSVTNATNYITGLFNQSATLYNNDDIDVTLSQVYVWDVPSPYTSNSTSTLLDQFGDYRTSFNGDLAHLIGYAGGGGIAWLSVLCSSSTSHRMAYSGISSSYQNVPTYSWSVEVVTHETGHNLGSRHTHACAWNGNNTAIDGCGPAAGYSEGSCAQGPLPSSSVGGTIMSYCHLTSSTIKFANGFGPQPTTLIVNNINNASCLTACSGGTCGTPAGLSAGGLTTTSAALSWGAVSGATSYTLQWKLSSGSTWTTVTGLTSSPYTLTGLTAGTAYQFQVLAVCSGGSSSYSAASSFTTLTSGGCADIQEPNGNTLQASTITSGTTYNGVIASATDADYYKLVVSSTSNITVSLTNLPFDYDVRLVNSSNTQLAVSQASGTTPESITYNNAAPGDYFVHVYGWNGVFSTQCYAMVATATVVSTCTDNYEPNETSGAARTISANSTITARIGSSTDSDWFRFSNTSSQRNVRVTLSNLPANYNMRLYRNNSLVATSANSGTTSEQITYNNSNGATTYKVNVYGVSGAFNASSCYTLTTQISATAFMPSGEMPEGAEVIAGEGGGELVLFPNPATMAVTILLPPGEQDTRVEMMDATGRVVEAFTSQAMWAEQRFIIDLQHLNDGIYFVRATDGEHQVVQRLVVQK